MPTASNDTYNQFTTVATMLVSNLIAVALAKGWITASIANSISANVATIGAVIIFLVANAAVIIGNQWHRLRYGPVPALPSPAPIVFAGQASPSYGPASTGEVTVDITDLPPEAV